MRETVSVHRPERQIVFSESAWEPVIGYSRGIRVGEQIFIAGTVAADGEGTPQGADAYEQTEFVIQKIQRTLNQLGGDLRDVVTTTTHLTDIGQHFDDYARAFNHYFRHITPVNTTIQAPLVRPDLFVEIGAQAIIR